MYCSLLLSPSYHGSLWPPAPLRHDGHAPRWPESLCGRGVSLLYHRRRGAFWILQKKGEKGKWTFVGTTYSIIAGSVGAIGALGIILALVFKGSPVFVMPLVFGFAPIVNTLVTAWMGGTLNKIRPVFVGGIMAAALGAGGVLYFKPPAKPAHAVEPSHSETEKTEASDAETKVEAESKSETESTKASPPRIDDLAASAPKPSIKPDVVKPEAVKPDTIKPDSTKADSTKAETKPTVAPEKDVESTASIPKTTAPLLAAQPDAGSPPVPVKPLIATRPIDGQPPVPVKPAPALVAAEPADGQPPQPEAVKPTKPKTAPAPATGSSPNIPPPVVNPESELSEPAATSDATKSDAPKSDAPKSDEKTTKELPPPVPNPESDLNAVHAPQREAVRLVSMMRAKISSADGERRRSENAPEDKKDVAKDVAAEKVAPAAPAGPNALMIALSIMMAAVCWDRMVRCCIKVR